MEGCLCEEWGAGKAPNEAKTACEPCPAGKAHSATPTATAVAYTCVFCAEDHYSTGAAAACSECPAGWATNAVGAGELWGWRGWARGGRVGRRVDLPLAEGLVVKLLNNATGGYDAYTVSNGAWSPGEPSVAPGQAFIVTAPSALNWSHDPKLPPVTVQPSDAPVVSPEFPVA